MSFLFRGCISLISIPDISKWNTSKVSKAREIFFGCTSLVSLPNISNLENSTLLKKGISDKCINLLNTYNI